MSTPDRAHAQIRKEAVEVGNFMDEVLPFRKRRLGIFALWSEKLQATAFSLDQTGEPDQFTRRWLEREITRRAADSPIWMMEDTVSVEEGADPILVEDAQVIAAYYPKQAVGLRIPDSLGMLQSEAMKRVSEIRAFTAAIEQAQEEQALAGVRVQHPATLVV